ncbi:MAG TPA: hypothetical protein DD706_03770 [Nitrospiraceae bacterium]|nr:hypothetical protein [Nitrospiraceae bacterium]
MLAESEAHLGAILNLAYDAVISVNAAHHIQRFNPGAEHLFGYRAEEVIGQPLDQLIPLALPLDLHEARHQVEPDSKAKQTDGATVQMQIRRKDGTRLAVEARICGNGAHHKLAFSIILRESTQRQAVEETFQESDRWLEERLIPISDV